MRPKHTNPEYHTPILSRTRQTLGVLTAHRPSLQVADFSIGALGALAESVRAAETARDIRKTEFCEAREAFRAANAALRAHTLKVPLLIKGQFKEQSAMAAMLPRIWAIVPRTPALAKKRARVLLPVWKAADAALAKRTPPEPRITQEGVGVVEFEQLGEALRALPLAQEHAATDFRAASIALRAKALLLDRWNKRFYQRLRAEARTDAALKAALKQIQAEPPSTRGKKGEKAPSPADSPLKTETAPATGSRKGDSL